MAIPVKLNVFEGPLDLLLHLIDKNKIDIYDSCPAENEDHGSIHINFDSNSGTGTITDTTSGSTETTSIGCYLTTACMRHMQNKFDDNCYELTTLRWFRDNFVSFPEKHRSLR